MTEEQWVALYPNEYERAQIRREMENLSPDPTRSVWTKGTDYDEQIAAKRLRGDTSN